jgi:hypothetical protein
MVGHLDYATHSAFSDPGRHRAAIEGLPDDPATIAATVQGWCLHDFVAEPFYGVTVPPARTDEIHIRPVEALLDRLLELDGRPLAEPRPADKRLAIRCRHYAVLMISILRTKGVPSRMRGGFSAYLNPPFFEDHWIVERRDAERWLLADPQLDAVWQQRLGEAFDPLDVPRDRFIVAADAWKRCRAGAADPAKFGISVGNLHGLWFVASSLVRDLAALNKVELLPWDVWGAQPGPGADVPAADLELFDRIGSVTADPERPAKQFASLYASEPRLAVGANVFNAIRMRQEALPAAA